ncbi:MAG: phosphoglucosamine mutase [Actinobacteria bacterium HGW-Actinobacteria-7]|jgi:phosphomannomutase|nr:MAG: phosphoglucosamine mutase [Actinobacteria bacterium HGW-Actinobacteria-7]
MARPDEPIHFGTDGWRAVIADEFTFANVRRIADATGSVVAAEHPGAAVVVGYDMRFEADAFAAAAAEVLASHGLTVRLSDRPIPTPGLSWAADRSDAVAGVMITASHNPAKYCGFKIKMADGGSAAPEFTKRIEAALSDEVPTARGEFETADLVGPYVADLATLVDGEAIRSAGLRTVIDPLYGAGQGYLAGIMRRLGVTVDEIHGEPNPGFGGLHPEPIPPYIDDMTRRVVELGFDAGFTTDGDADRIGACDRHGAFVNPQRIFGLVLLHLARDRGMTGRVLKSITTTVLIDRLCAHLGLPCETTPVGFKFIHEKMVDGDGPVLIGGEESGGIAVTSHLVERDGLAMALYLAEMMAQGGHSLDELVSDMFAITGPMEYRRVDLTLDPAIKHAFVGSIPDLAPASLGGQQVLGILHTDGVKFLLPEDSWMLLRASGTEPLVRVYAEASSTSAVDALLDAGRALVTRGL